MALREHLGPLLRDVFLAGVTACDPDAATRRALEGGALAIEGPVWLLGAGKASARMARAASQILGSRVRGGCVVVKDGYECEVPGVEVIAAGHPSPDARSMVAAQRLSHFAERAVAGETVLMLLSGGASSLMAAPVAGLELSDLYAVNNVMLSCGASIAETNTVRKRMLALSGGRLGARVPPARLVTLVVSDVVGNPLTVIGSGPTVGDDTGFADALDIIARYDLREQLSPSIVGRFEVGARGHLTDSPRRVAGDVMVILDNQVAISACAAAAAARGLAVNRLPRPLVGEAAAAGRWLAALAREHTGCLVGGGETTVKVTGDGRGGRNQELALAAALELAGGGNIAVLAAGTDGTDGPTDAAGAVAYGDTLLRANALGLDARAHLARHDSLPFFAALGDLVMTGPTHTNVMDIQVAIRL